MCVCVYLFSLQYFICSFIFSLLFFFFSHCFIFIFFYFFHLFFFNSELDGALFPGQEEIMHYTGLLSLPFTKKLVKKVCNFFLIKIKHKKNCFLYHHRLKAKVLDPSPPNPNIPINNHLNIVLLVSHFKLTNMSPSGGKKTKKQETRKRKKNNIVAET